MEIFDYLDGRDLFYAFSNLNLRFEQLIMDPMLYLKINFSTAHGRSFEQDYQQIVIPNRHRITSLHLCTRSQSIISYALYPIDLSFHRLEYLVLNQIQYQEIMSILPCLAKLPYLYSLSICLNDTLVDAGAIYRLIFRLPMLKYNKISGKVFVPVSTSAILARRLTSIEQLVIDHTCSLSTLYDILSHTPKLRRLICDDLSAIYINLRTEIPIKIFDLKYCSISFCYITFEEFVVLAKKAFSQLRVLRYSSYKDTAYLDADRWERLIINHMPYLHTFQFTYHNYLYNRSVVNPYHSSINRFTSQFWIERGWCLNIEVDLSHWPPTDIMLSIQPKW